MHCAAQYGHIQIAEILLTAKADVNIQDKSGLTALHYAVYLGNKIEMVKSLLRAGAINAQIKCGFTPVICEFTPLHYAARYGHTQIVKTLLKEGHADVNVQDKNGETPLHRAIYENEHIQVVEILLEEGAKVNLQGKDRKTPLHYAAEHGHTKTAKLLLKNGANIDLQDKKGVLNKPYASS